MRKHPALLMRTGLVDYDDRKSAIEVQVNQTITLRDQLLFVVLPKEFLEETAIRDAIINVWNCDPVIYATFQGDTPASYYAVVREKSENALQRPRGYEHDRHLHAGRHLPSEAAWSGFRHSGIFARWPVLGPGHLQRRPREAIRYVRCGGPDAPSPSVTYRVYDAQYREADSLRL